MRQAILLLAFLPVLTTSCNSKKKQVQKGFTSMYDFNNPKTIELSTTMDEISGLAYYAEDTSVFAIVDETGTLFKIPLKNPKAFKKWEFDEGKDYEDIVYKDSAFYILNSNGNIFKLTFNGKDFVTRKFDFFTNDKAINEFEILFENPKTNNFELVCKSCEADDKTKLSKFIFSETADSAYIKDGAIDMMPFIQKFGADKHLKPSAGAVNPINGDVYLVSSILKAIVIYDSNYRLKEIVKLNSVKYKQPEGITFTPEGHIVISNEFANEGNPTLLLIKNLQYKQP